MLGAVMFASFAMLLKVAASYPHWRNWFKETFKLTRLTFVDIRYPFLKDLHYKNLK